MALLVKIGADLQSFDRKMKRATKEISSIGKKFNKVGKGLTKGVTVPLVGIGVAAANIGATFEAQMNRVSAISGATGKDLDSLEGKARELGSKTKFSATEAAKGLEYFAMAGYSVEDSMNAIEPTLNLAIASGEDLAMVADIVSDSMTAFGMSAKQTSEFTDLLASVSTNANTNVSMLGESFKYVAPVAGAMGYAAQDVAMALGLMANAGIKGSQAGTALRGALTRMTKPSAEAKKAIEELGIKMADSKGNMLPLGNVVNQLRDKFSTLTQEQQTQAATTLFGKEAMSGMLAIINASETDMNKLGEATTNYNGKAQEMAEIMQSGTQGAFATLKSSLEELAISLSQTLLPIINNVIAKIQGWVDKFNALSPAQQETIVKIGMIIAAIGPLLLAIGKTITIVGKLSAAFKIIGAGIAAINAPIVLIVAAITGLIAIFVRLYQTNEEFRNKVNALWEQIKEFFSAAINFIKSLIETLMQALQFAWENNFENIQGIVKAGWDYITTVFTAAIDILKGIFEVFTKVLQGDWSGAWEAIKSLLKTIVDSIGKILTSWFDFILNIFGTNLDNVVGTVKDKLGKVMGVFENLRDKAKGVVNSIVGFFRNMKLPKFGLKWSSKTFFGKKISYPTGFNINWHAEGGIFTKPTVLGGHGFGEAGKEAILPLSKLPGLLGLDNQKTNHITIYLDGMPIYDGIDTFLGNKVLGGI